MWKPPDSVFLEFKGQQEEDWKSWLVPVQRGLSTLGQEQWGYAMRDMRGISELY